MAREKREPRNYDEPTKLQAIESKYNFLGGADIANYSGFMRLSDDITGLTEHGEGWIMPASGDGMNGAHICNGDYLLFKATTEAEDGDIVCVIKPSEPRNTMCRRYVKQNAGFVIRREDGITPDEDAKDYVIVGKLMTVIRKMFKETA